jgi:hypothetical protein
MNLFPSVVVGVGTSGASVVASIERIFFEVLGDTRLDLIRLLVIETDTRQRDFDMTPGGRISRLVDAHENDVHQAIQNLKAHLSDDFAWCPDDLNIQGHGAGNVRAGGRLLFHSKFAPIKAALSDAIQNAVHSGTRTEVQNSIDLLFNRRGLPLCRWDARGRNLFWDVRRFRIHCPPGRSSSAPDRGLFPSRRRRCSHFSRECLGCIDRSRVFLRARRPLQGSLAE